MNDISFTYSPWLLLLCILLGLFYAGLLYFRNRRFEEQPAWLQWLMATLRFLAVFGISSLLLGPVIKQIKDHQQKPAVLILQDHSESIAAVMDTTERVRYESRVDALAESLAEDAEVSRFVFGDKLQEGPPGAYGEQVTNLSNALQEALDRFAGRNPVALILASDGIFNEGKNPLYLDRVPQIPVYTVALGDTTRRKDVSIKNVYANRIAYLGDQMAIQVDLEAINCGGEEIVLTSYAYGENGRTVADTRSYRIGTEEFFTTAEFIMDLPNAGVQRFRFAATVVGGEENRANNFRDVYVEVLDARQKILVLADAPHPDLAAIKELLESGRNKEVEVAFAGEFIGAVNPYDLLILHQLPSRKHPIANVLDQVRKQEKSHCFILGAQTDIRRLNTVQEVVTIEGANSQMNEIYSVLNPGFSFFTVDEEAQKQFTTYPPLMAPFGEYATDGAAQVLSWQKVGSVVTEYPLVAFLDKDGVKSAVIAGEGIWRWKLYDYLQHSNFDRVQKFLSKLTQYLTVKEDKRRFRVYAGENVYKENEPVFFDAEFYNASYELLNEPDAGLLITDADGNQYNYTFNRSYNAYRLNAGMFGEGDYQWEANLDFEGENFRNRGAFSVQPLQLELYETTADHGLLRLLARNSNGSFYYPDQLEQVGSELRESGRLRPVFYSSTRTNPLVKVEWILGLFLLLLAVEWFIRKYLGAY